MDRKTIKDHEYACGVLPLRVSTEILARVSNLVGPTLLEGALGGGIEHMASELKAALRSVSHEDLEWFADKFGAVSECDGKPLTNPGARDAAFRGRLSDYFRWLGYCFEVNFADFFEDVQTLTRGV